MFAALRRPLVCTVVVAFCTLFGAAAWAQTTASQVTSGFRHSCALADGSVWCWGENAVDQLGQGAPGGPSSVPVQVSDLSGATQISAGTYQTCALKSDQTAWCWGTLGQSLGSPLWPSPAQFTALGADHFAAIAAGQFDTCGLLTDTQTIVCTGDPGRSILGAHVFPNPVAVDSAGRYMIGVGAYQACAGLIDGTVWCFGDNGFGPPAAPAQAAGPWISAASGVTASYSNFACATFGDGSAWCWNDNGGSSGFTQILTPGSGAAGIAGQNDHLCALVSDGGAACWNDFGPAVVVPDLAGASEIAAGGTPGDGPFGCALVSGGVACWGNNTFGQLGDGTTTASSTPVNVFGFAPPPPPPPPSVDALVQQLAIFIDDLDLKRHQEQSALKKLDKLLKALASDKKNSTKKACQELDELLKQISKKAFMKSLTPSEEAELVHRINEIQTLVGCS